MTGKSFQRLISWSPMILFCALVIAVVVTKRLTGDADLEAGVLSTETCAAFCDKFVECVVARNGGEEQMGPHLSMVRSGCFSGCGKTDYARQVEACFEESEGDCARLEACVFTEVFGSVPRPRQN